MRRKCEDFLSACHGRQPAVPRCPAVCVRVLIDDVLAQHDYAMRLTIAGRLFLALALTSAVTLILNAGLTRWNFQRGFMAYIEELEAQRIERIRSTLADAYVADEWDSLRTSPRSWHDVLVRSGSRPPPPRAGRPPPGDGPGRPGRERRGDRPPRPADPLRVGQRFALLDASDQLVAGRAVVSEETDRYPIESRGERVGTLLVAKIPDLRAPGDREFSREQQKASYLSLAVAIAVAALLSAILARQITRPIRSLAEGTKAIAKGEFGANVAADRHDELGELARDFNQLSDTLFNNRESRRQWTNDIAHELRTPLSIIKGELDAIRDGVRPFDESTLESLRAEAERLGKLVADLRQLAISDEGRLTLEITSVDVVQLLHDSLLAAEIRLSEAGIKLETELPDYPLMISADPNRIDQLFANLIANTIRYTDSPGQLLVTCRTEHDQLLIDFQDSPPDVPDAALERIFDRLYRVDASRSRATGGSGLGMAICAAIVSGHGGSISASRSQLGGLRVSISLPYLRK